MSDRTPHAGPIAIRMPKWGLSMDQGQINAWLKREGERFAEGEHLADIETSKINNAFEAPTSGLLRRIVAREGDTVAVGGLLAVAAEADIADSVIDSFVSEFQASFVPDVAEEQSEAGMTKQVVPAGNLKINVTSSGAGGVPVVLIHGFASDLTSWMLNTDAIAATRRVIALDMPGHGESSKEIRSGSVEELADAVAEALAYLNIERAHLIGHSLGGAVAMELAQRFPGRFCALVLIAPAGLPGSTVNRAFLDAIVEGERARQLKPWLEMLFHDPVRASAEIVDKMVQYKRIDAVPEALAAIRDQLARHSSGPLDRQLPPTLLILGQSDRIVSHPDVAALPANWQVVTLADVGHMPQLEQAAKCNELAIRFISEHSRG